VLSRLTFQTESGLRLRTRTYSAVTHYLGMDVLDATGTHAINARIVEDGDLVSSGGVASGIDLALYLLERLHSPQLAIATEELFEFERRGTMWKSTERPIEESFSEAVCLSNSEAVLVAL
jgi:transcriptional regulator GlxA family with amidase domain